MTDLKLANRIPFNLVSYRKLKALSDLKIYIPASILEPPGTPLSELILLSDPETEVGIVESMHQPGVAAAIVISMKLGDEISLSRSAEVFIDGVPDGQVAFEALG